MLKVNNVSKAFGKNEVLQNVSIRIDKGDVVVIIGPSGSGKTTLLRCISFLEKADQGEIEIGDLRADLAEASKKQMLAIRRRMAFVFQNYNLFNNKTALENVVEGLITARKMPKGEAVETGKKALDRVHLSQKYDFYPNQLSGGQQQRVGIARAVAVNPDVILFDEPTSALDPELTGEVLSVMKDLAGDGTTMLVVTHEISFAEDGANRIVFFEGGNIVEEGAPNVILFRPEKDRTKQFLKGRFALM